MSQRVSDYILSRILKVLFIYVQNDRRSPLDTLVDIKIDTVDETLLDWLNIFKQM